MAVDHVCNRIDSVRDRLPNAIDGLEPKKLGSGRIFERTDEEVRAGQTGGKSLPKFYGHALVLLASGPRYIDVAAGHRPDHNFYLGNPV